MDKKQEKNFFTIIKKPIITDKTTKLLENNQYCFQVDHRADKIQIKKAIEYIFNVKVQKINTYHRPYKKRTVGRFKGYKSHYKRAIIKLSQKDKIDLFTDNS